MAIPKSKKSSANPLMQHIQKNPKGFVCMVVSVLCVLYVLLSTPETPQQLNFREGTLQTMTSFNTGSERLRNLVQRAKGPLSVTEKDKAAKFWTTLTPFQRAHVAEKTLETAGNDMQRGVHELGLKGGNGGEFKLATMFKTIAPDVTSGQGPFVSDAAYLWQLWEHWEHQDSLNPNVVDELSMDDINNAIKQGFWGGLDKFGFSESAQYEFSSMGWTGARNLGLGYFFKNVVPAINGIADRLSEGEGMYDIFPVPPKSWADETKDKRVVHLTDDAFAKQLAKEGRKHAVVMFYAPWCGHCKKMKPELVAASASLHEEGADVTIAAVDCTVERKLCKQYKVTGFPTNLHFIDGVHVGEFDGKRTHHGIVDWINAPERLNGALDTLEESIRPVPEKTWEEEEGAKDVTFMTDASFEADVKKNKHALVMFYAPWCGHCKAFKPDFQAAATALVNADAGVTLGAYDADVHKTYGGKYDVTGFPTVLWFEDGAMFEKYEAARTKEGVIAWVNEKKGIKVEL